MGSIGIAKSLRRSQDWIDDIAQNLAMRRKIAEENKRRQGFASYLSGKDMKDFNLNSMENFLEMLNAKGNATPEDYITGMPVARKAGQEELGEASTRALQSAHTQKALKDVEVEQWNMDHPKAVEPNKPQKLIRNGEEVFDIWQPGDKFYKEPTYDQTRSGKLSDQYETISQNLIEAKKNMMYNHVTYNEETHQFTPAGQAIINDYWQQLEALRKQIDKEAEVGPQTQSPSGKNKTTKGGLQYEVVP